MSLKFVLAPDSYKNSASAIEICEAMVVGIRRVFPDSEVIHVPMADGGEGQIDFQTKYGKTPYGVLQAAKEVDEEIKVVAICGSIGEGVHELYELGFDGIFGTIPAIVDFDMAIKNTKHNVTRISEAVTRLLK